MNKVLLLLLLPLFCLGQQKTIKKEGDTQNGKGELIFEQEDGSKVFWKGNFKNGRLEGENGEEKIEQQEITQISKGDFEQGELIKGQIEYQNGEFRRILFGEFKNSKLHGTNCIQEVFYENGDVLIEEGRFINGSLIDGTQDSKYANGLNEACEYKDGEKKDCIKNNRNHYNPDDIIGGSSSKVILEILNDAAFIEIGFGNTKTNIKWDTGAYGLALSKYDFRKLLESGVEFFDLNLKAVSYGVANIPLEGKTLILNNLKIGEYTVNNVVCTYQPTMERSLIGMNFFDKFDNVTWDKKKEYLILYK